MRFERSKSVCEYYSLMRRERRDIIMSKAFLTLDFSSSKLEWSSVSWSIIFLVLILTEMWFFDTINANDGEELESIWS